MTEKIEVLGISMEKCYVADIMESINENWYKDLLSTYGVIDMNLLMAARNEEALEQYIDSLDKAVVNETEVLKAAGIHDSRLEEEAREHDFLSSLFWFLDRYRNHIFLLGETDTDTEILYSYLKEKYPEIIIDGRESLLDGQADQTDKIINEINNAGPQAVLGCSREYGMERFVRENRKKMNTHVFFCLGNLQNIKKEQGIKRNWLERLLERNSFKKLVLQYKEENDNQNKGDDRDAGKEK